ncbi:sensory rhodopsin transducer [Paenibacillus ginsengihumi]|uniref:sensory rhodopsin transducer n=1 Tax=Paenibacillus ginsengihumi TaxID=431596 RepID=UPI0003634B2E|nr:sensory rhodopsin transducer [Paenibacillus ginsengihumi]
MSVAKGHTLWFIPDGYIPPTSSGELESHESICVLNCGHEDAALSITVYFEDRPPIERIEAVVPGRRTMHIRTAGLSKDGERIPKGVPYAMEVESTVPVIVQYSRLDSTQAANALMSVMAYPYPNETKG